MVFEQSLQCSSLVNPPTLERVLAAGKSVSSTKLWVRLGLFFGVHASRRESSTAACSCLRSDMIGCAGSSRKLSSSSVSELFLSTTCSCRNCSLGFVLAVEGCCDGVGIKAGESWSVSVVS